MSIYLGTTHDMYNFPIADWLGELIV